MTFLSKILGIVEIKDISNSEQISRNLIFNIISFAINFCISFFFTPYLIRTVGKEAYSFFPLVNNIIGYSTILTAAVGSMGGRFITMRFYKDDILGANQYFNSVWVANCVLSVILTLASIIAVIYINEVLTVPEQLISDVRWLFAFGSLSMIIGLLTGLFGLGTYVKNRLDLSASTNAIGNIARISLILGLFWLFNPSIIYMSLSALIAALLTMYFNISFKRLLLPELTFAPKTYFSWTKIVEVTKSGVWNSLNQLGSVLLNQIDLLITNLFIGAAATADYAIAKTAPVLILSLLAMLSGIFMPQFNILYAQGQTDELIKAVSRSISIVSLLIGIPMGFLIVFSKPFFELWVPSVDAEMLYWLSLLTVAPLIVGASINPVYGLFVVTNKLKVPTIFLLLGSSLQTLVIYIVIKTTDLGIFAIPIVSGIQSIARNTLFTTVYGGLCLGLSWKKFFPALLKGIIGMIVIIIIACAVSQIISIHSWITLFLVFVGVGIVSACINLFIIFNKNDRLIVFDMVKSKLHLNKNS